MARKTTYFTKSKVIATVAIAVVILISASVSPFIAMADSGDVWLEHDEESTILRWTLPSNKDDIDGFVIRINNNPTYANGNNVSYFDITNLLKEAGLYNISVYASINGNETLIGSCTTITTATLDSVTNVIFDGGNLTWCKVNYADKYLVFVNDVFVSCVYEENCNIAPILALSGEYEVIILPLSNNPYVFVGTPTYKTISVKSTVDLPFKVYVFNYLDSIILSWQGVEGITYSYTLTSSTSSISSSTTNTNVTFENLEDGTYAFTLFGNDGSVDYNFGTTVFSVVNGQVRYE